MPHIGELQVIQAVEPFIAPALLNSWVDFGAGFNPCGYQRVGSFVRLRGLIKSGVVPATAFTLPVGYRPANIELLNAISNNALGRIDIQTNGDAIIRVGSNVYFSLDGMTFLAV